MFGRLKKLKCPVGPTDQKWLEDNWLLLCNALGTDIIHNADTIDSDDAYRMKDEPFDVFATDLLEQCCPRFGLDHTAITVGTYEDARPETQADMDDEAERLAEQGVAIIWLPGEITPDPAYVASSVISRLAMWTWPNDAFEFDDEQQALQLAELTAVQFGFGVLIANAAISDGAWNNGVMGGWQTYRRTHLLVYHLGYALALYGWSRDETEPVWRHKLTKDAAYAFDRGVAYLQATQSSPSAEQQ